MKQFLLSLVLVGCVGCGNSPTSPTKIEPANIVSTNAGTFSYLNPYSSVFNLVLKNTGSGCASHVRGIITFSTGTGIKLITLQWQTDILVVRPGETFVVTVDTEADLTLAQSYQVEANWTNAVCY